MEGFGRKGERCESRHVCPAPARRGGHAEGRISRLPWSLQGQNSASRRRRAAPKPIFWELAGPGPGPGGLQLLLLRAAITPCAEASENGEKNPSGHLQPALATATSQFLHHTDTRSPFNACMSECRLQRDRVTRAGTFGVAASNPAAPGAKTRAGCPAPRPGGPGRLRGRKLRSLCQGSSRLRQTNRKKKIKIQRIQAELGVL